jgi:hypothetical protein
MKKTFLASLLFLTFFFAFSTLSIHAQRDASQNLGDGNSQNSGDNTTGNTGDGTAGNDSVGINFNIPNPFNSRVGDSLFGLMKAIINNIVMPIGGVLAVLAFIYSGFLYVTAGGNETKIKTANNALLWASIGTAVLLGSWVLANVICRTINLLGGPICPA